MPEVKLWKNYKAVPCTCGLVTCSSWHVWPVAAVPCGYRCVSFTEIQAKAVAVLLNTMEKVEAEPCPKS